MKKNKVLISLAVILTLTTSMSYGATINYTVKSKDTYWKISERYNLNLSQLLKDNNGYNNSSLYPGQIIKVTYDESAQTLHSVKEGDTYWQISNRYGVNLNELMTINNGYNQPYLRKGDILIIPQKTVATMAALKTGPSVTYTHYYVKSQDTIWTIAKKFGIPHTELMKKNNLTENSSLTIGQKLVIPVHHVPVKSTPGPSYGEYLDWWTEAQYVVPIGRTFKVVDFYTGKIWSMKRTVGANHADVEPLTAADSAIIKKVWGGNFSWQERPVLILIDGRKIAASMASTPHDVDYVPGNGVQGHMDIHFLNSTTHKTGVKNPDHQFNVKLAAGK